MWCISHFDSTKKSEIEDKEREKDLLLLDNLYHKFGSAFLFGAKILRRFTSKKIYNFYLNI